jgi:plasmid stabilization system protein ParE
MVERIIVWSSKAKLDLKNLFEFYNHRNKSKTFSLKFHRKIQKEIQLLIQQPEIGKKSNKIGVRGLLIDNHFIFYEIFQEQIVILAVWHTCQNPSNLKL